MHAPKKIKMRKAYLAQAGGAQCVPQQEAERPLDLSSTVAVGAGPHLTKEHPEEHSNTKKIANEMKKRYSTILAVRRGTTHLELEK